MRHIICTSLVMLAFLAAVAGCQEHGAKPPESRIATQNRRSEPVRPDPNRLMKEALREQLAAKLRARGHGPEEARALAREAIPDDQNLGEIYPGDDTPLWEKTPEELQEELRRGLEEAGLPPQFIEKEIRALAEGSGPLGPKPGPEPPHKQADASQDAAAPDPAQLRQQLRESLEQSGLPQQFIEQEVEARVPESSPPPPVPPGAGPPVPPPDQPELDPVQLQKELRESLEQTNLPPQFIENEVRGSVPEASPPPPAWQPPGASFTSPPDQPELDPAQLQKELRESLKQTKLPPKFIEAEVELRTGGSSQPPQGSPEPPPEFPESFP